MIGKPRCRGSALPRIGLGLIGLSSLPNAGPSTPLKYASLRMTVHFSIRTLETVRWVERCIQKGIVWVIFALARYLSHKSPKSDYLLLLPKIPCYSLTKSIDSQRGQFWGRAALAPVILLGSGRF